MELVKVNITTQALTARYGTLNPGDSVLTDAKYANHLVHDCGAGEFAKPPVAAAKESEAEAAAAEATSKTAKKNATPK